MKCGETNINYDLAPVGTTDAKGRLRVRCPTSRGLQGRVEEGGQGSWESEVIRKDYLGKGHLGGLKKCNESATLRSLWSHEGLVQVLRER